MVLCVSRHHEMRAQPVAHLHIDRPYSIHNVAAHAARYIDTIIDTSADHSHMPMHRPIDARHRCTTVNVQRYAGSAAGDMVQ